MNKSFYKKLVAFSVFMGMSFFSCIFFSNNIYAASVTATVRISVCGNAVTEYGEECDNSDLNNKTCEDLGYGSGNLFCQSDCSYGVANCKKLENKTSNNKDNNSDTRNNQNSGLGNVEANNLGNNPTEVIGVIEKNNETRTLEIEKNFSDYSNNLDAPGDSVVKFFKVDTDNEEIQLKIETNNNYFVISQDDISANSQFSIVLDEKLKKVFILGPNGKIELKKFPKEVYDKIKIENNNYHIEKIEITENKGMVVYAVSLKKEEKLFGLIKIKIPFKVEYEIQSGELFKIKKIFLWKVVDLVCF